MGGGGITIIIMIPGLILYYNQVPWYGKRVLVHVLFESESRTFLILDSHSTKRGSRYLIASHSFIYIYIYFFVACGP